MKREYSGSRINDWDKSFVTFTMTRTVDADGAENFDAQFEISYIPATVDWCSEESIIHLPRLDDTNPCGPETQLRMRLFYKANVDEEEMKKTALESYNAKWNEFKSAKSAPKNLKFLE